MLQLIKFCLVGATSTAINQAILWILLTYVPALPWWFSQSIAFSFSVTNGFFLNRAWTFKSAATSKTQYPKFFLTNTVGLLLNLLITKGFLIMFTGQLAHSENPDTKQTMLATLCAVPLVVIWNFSAARFWTFKTPKNPTPNGEGTPSVPPIASP